jgi:hypothetical protein
MPLWQHMELRRTKTAWQGRDPRPSSLLITPELSASRIDWLQELKIDWVAGTVQSFAEDIATRFAEESRQGFAFITKYDRTTLGARIPLVGDLAAEHPSRDTEYLLGQEPIWADILTGRAAHRDSDVELLSIATSFIRDEKPATALAVTGTAGSGKSTALMSLGVSLSKSGIPVYWIDKTSEAPVSRILATLRELSGAVALIVDDADLFGRQFVGLLTDLVPSRSQLLVAFGSRANRIDDIADMIAAGGQVNLLEYTVPPLTDGDIDRLILTLDQHNRLGILKGKTDPERRRIFRDLADRQILVAMYKATTGEEFEEKVQDEVAQLGGEQRWVYSLLCLATSQREFLTKDEVLLASGDAAAGALDALDRLVARHIAVATPPRYYYTARHRVVADLVVTKLQQLGELKDVFVRLAFAIASKVTPGTERQGRIWRLLKRITNYKLLRRLVGVGGARELYETAETLLAFDYHYWLQRGSLEVAAGDLRLAEQFLDQARSLAPEDYKVETEYGYLLMRKAVERPTDAEAEKLLTRGIDLLEDAILFRGSTDSYPVHVLGSQGLAWVHRAPLTDVEKRRFLDRLLNAAEQGVRLHPRQRDLVQLRDDIRREVLLTVVAT